MRKQLPLIIFLLLPLLVVAQTVTVPNNVYFADVHLKISDKAQQEIQKKVDALHRNPTYFQKKVDLADTYFPIIERVFKEEGVPDDFKYLALQESGLIGDAVSTSNAVGYWQFKKEAAMDFNLRMNNSVDERKHIIEASRGAAKYFKRSNANYDNWFTSLLSYYLGYTGVQTYSKPSDKGSKKLDVTEKSHPYVITFLAHKIAYDNFVGKNKPQISLQEMRAKPGQSLSDIALTTKTDYAELERYNKWLLGSSIPSDKDYYVIVPVKNVDTGLIASNEAKPPVAVKISQQAAASLVKRNGLNALVAREGDTKDRLALQAGISTRKFLRYNDMHNFDPIIAGTAYYIEAKNFNAETEYHVVQPGETMQMVAQHYGVRLTHLLFKNRMARTEVPVPGRVLWLQKRRPSSIPVEVKDLKGKQTVATSTAKQSVEATYAAEQPQENFFTRFINSFKRFRQQPEQATTAPVSKTEVQNEPTSEPTKSQTHQATAAATPEQPEPAKETTLKATAVEKALYPVKEEEPIAQENKNPVEPIDTTKTTEANYFEEELEEEEGLLGKKSTELPAEPMPAKTEKPETIEKPAQQKNAANPTRHVVKQGETLYSISRMYAVTVNELSNWNQLGDTPIKLGQELFIAEPLNTPAATEHASTEETQPSQETEFHTVVSGETLYQISKTYNVPLQELREWNNLADNNIKLGQVIRVTAPFTAKATPAPDEHTKQAATQTTKTYHVVAPGESMYQISRKYGVTIKDVMEWNNKPDFTVSIGEKLLIKKK